MFESPAFLLLLGLVPPWVWWSLRRRPRSWPVGGLEPFRGLPQASGRRRRAALEAWLGALALGAGALALAGPRSAPAPGPLLLDRSLSHLGPDPGPVPAGVLAVGGPGEAVDARRLLEELRRLGPPPGTRVRTDLAPPRGLPPDLDWGPSAAARPAADARGVLRQLWFEDGAWRVHWIRLAPGALRLEAGTRILELPAGETEGIAVLGADLAPGTVLRLRAPAQEDPLPWPQLRVHRPLVFSIPREASEGLRRGLRALYPGAVLRERPGPGEAVAAGSWRHLAFGPGGLLPAGDPFPGAEPLEALARLQAALEAARARDPEAAREPPPAWPREEFLPAPPLDWPEDLEPLPAGGGGLDLPLAAAGLLLLLLARWAGRRR